MGLRSGTPSGGVSWLSGDVVDGVDPAVVADADVLLRWLTQRAGSGPSPRWGAAGVWSGSDRSLYLTQRRIGLALDGRDPDPVWALVWRVLRDQVDRASIAGGTNKMAHPAAMLRTFIVACPSVPLAEALLIDVRGWVNQDVSVFVAAYALNQTPGVAALLTSDLFRALDDETARNVFTHLGLVAAPVVANPHAPLHVKMDALSWANEPVAVMDRVLRVEDLPADQWAELVALLPPDSFGYGPWLLMLPATPPPPPEGASAKRPARTPVGQRRARVAARIDALAHVAHGPAALAHLVTPDVPDTPLFRWWRPADSTIDGEPAWEWLARHPHPEAPTVLTKAKWLRGGVATGQYRRVRRLLLTHDDASVRRAAFRARLHHDPDLTDALVDPLLDADTAVRVSGLVEAWDTFGPDRATPLVHAATPPTRRAMARRLTCPDTLLGLLADDPDWRTRATVAKNPRTPAHVLTGLTDDPDERVRAAVTDTLLRAT